MNTTQLQIAKECAEKTREYILAKHKTLDGQCKLAAQLMVKALTSRGLTASVHYGWCIYDRSDNSTGEPCAPHCYILLHSGPQRYYLDCTATQFQFALDEHIPEVIMLPPGERPYWFRAKKPSIKELERVAGY